MDTRIATMGKGKTLEALCLLPVHPRPRLVVLHGPRKKQTGCHPDHLLQVIRAGKDKASEATLCGTTVEGDHHRVKGVEEGEEVLPVEIPTFQATLAGMAIAIVTKDVEAEMMVIDEKIEVTENGKGTEEAKSFEILDGAEAEALIGNATEIVRPTDGDRYLG